MRHKALSIILIIAVTLALALAFGVGCSKSKKKNPFAPSNTPPSTYTPGASGGPISGTFTFIAVTGGTNTALSGVSVYVSGAAETKLTNSSGMAVFEGVTGPQDVTFWEDPAAKRTLFAINAAQLVVPFTPSVSSTPGSKQVDLIIKGASNMGGDYFGAGFATLDNGGYSFAPFGVLITSIIPNPLTIEVATGTPAVVGAVTMGLDNSISKYAILEYPSGVPDSTTSITLDLTSAGDAQLIDFAGTIDTSALSFSPANGFCGLMMSTDEGDVIPTGGGSVDLGNNTYSGMGFLIPDRDRYGFFVIAGAVGSGLSATIKWGTFSDIPTIANSSVILYDIPLVTEPLGAATGVAKATTVTWTEIAQADIYMISITQTGYTWTGVLNAPASTATVPAIAELLGSTGAVVTVSALDIDNWDYSSFDLEELMMLSNYFGLSIPVGFETGP